MATVASVKAKIQGLIDKANKTTNRRDLQLSPAFDALIEGYGRGDSGGIIDVTELPEIEKAKEGYVYRLISETPETAEILMAVLDGNSIHMETLQHMFEQEGIMANTTTTIVSALPSTMQPINEATLTIPFYVLESTGVAYLSLDGTNTNVVTLGQLFEGVDGGWIGHIDEIYGENLTNVPTFFCLRVEGSTETKGLYIAIERVWYYYKRIIDVEKLPTGADNNAIYRVGKYVTKDLYICLAGGELRPFVEYVKEIYGDNANLNKVEFVDALPSPHETATVYILNTTGVMYTDVDGTLEPYGNDALSVMMFGTYYGLCDADAVDLNYPGLYAVREGIVIEKYCVKVGGKWIEFKSKSIFQEYAAGWLTELKGEDLLGVTRIADHALANYKPLEKATIPSNVANIGDSAFENCENLKEIVFHDNLMGIGNRAFYGCKSITEIDWYSLRNLWDIYEEAFAYCTSLKHAAPTSGDNGGGYIYSARCAGLFKGCTALETATIDFRPGAGWLDCGSMFAGCTSLHTFTDNVGMDYMPAGMFKGCSSLKDIYVPTTKANWSSWEKGEKWDQGTPDYVIHCTDGDILKSDPESGSDDRPDVPEGDSEWFNDGKTHLWIEVYDDERKDVVLRFQQTVANGVTIDWGDGSEAQTLSGTGNRSATHTYASTGEYVITLDVQEGCILTLGGTQPDNNAFGKTFSASGTMLRAVEFGNNVTNLGYYTFHSCVGLRKVKTSDSVTDFNAYVGFAYCHSLKSITIPDGVTQIGAELFRGCSALTKVIIPETVTSMYNSAFSECRSLTRIEIPSGVTSIASALFGSCTAMKVYDFTKHTAVPTLVATNAFYNIPFDCEIRVPAALYDEWIAATNWSTYASKIVGV